MDVPRIDRSLGELFSDLSQQTADLIRQEMRLAKAELEREARRRRQARDDDRRGDGVRPRGRRHARRRRSRCC